MHFCRFMNTHGKKLALLLSVAILLTLVLGGTLAFVITRTPSLYNTFVSGVDPTGDLVIRKNVIHPFGDTYTVPEELSFGFTVDLGAKYAGKTLVTSQGKVTADTNGVITLSVGAGEAVRVQELLVGTSVTVTEGEKTGFTTGGENPRSLTVARGENETVFDNTYAPAPADATLLAVAGTKYIDGRPWQAGDSFTFQLEYKRAGDAQWQSLGTAAVTYEQIQIQDPEFPDDPEKLIWVDKPDFDKFNFTDLVQSLSYDAAGTYSFRVSEVEGTIGGMGYDSVVSYFDVLIGDRDMDGALEVQDVTGYQNAVATYEQTANKFTVEISVRNTYAPEGTASATIHILKTVESLSGEEQSPAGYTFELYDEKGQLVQTSGVTSAAGETAISLTFEAKDAGKTFRYILKETNAGQTLNGMTYDETEHKIEISVIDNLDGTVSTNVTLVEETEENTTTENQNVEEVDENTTALNVSVEETTEAPTEPETTEAPTEPETTEAPTESETTEAPTESETTEPPTESETAETPTEPETTEATASADQVDDPAQETPISNVCYVTFRNRYDPKDTDATISGTKKLTGRPLGTGDFTFELYAVAEDFVIGENAKPIQSVANNGAGAFAFSAMDYDRVGTYCYVVKENADTKLGGVTYDTTAYRVTVTVTDENGELKAAVAVTDELGKTADLIFRNSYAAQKATVTFTGVKTLTGAELADWQFRFLLYKADAEFNLQGESVGEAFSDASGNFTFADYALTAEEEYYFVIVEDASAAVEGMDYDETVYGIHVSVTDDGVGQLHAAVQYYCNGQQVDGITFANIYTAPETTDPTVPDTTEPDDTTKPTVPADPDLPPTGDPTQPIFLMAVMLLSAAAVAILTLLGRRKRT